ncbi:MAG: hypothetical protein ABI675_08030 [Chitinophagaceae bacterium]
MMITRHNYEEYFILYMDNELASEDRRLVELFVQENADLKDELDWLMQSRLAPDASIVFDNKKQLMKSSGAESININNYEEWLLLYTDNELTAEQKGTVEKFAAAHPAIQEGLQLLQKTKFQPEQEITFHNKELLYRKEEKVRVIAINWRKIAVAAVLLVTISTTALIVFNKKKPAGPATEIASAKKPEIKSTPANPDRSAGVTTNTNPIAEDNSSNKAQVKEAVINSPVVTIDKKTIAPKEKNIQRSVLPAKEDAPVVAVTNSEKKKTNDLPEPKYNPNVTTHIEQDNPIVLNDIQVKESLTFPKENIKGQVVTPGNSQSLDNVVTASSIEEQPGKKNKLRGFFRKVTRTFEKATNIKATDDEDRLLLGGLAIKL